MRLSSALWISIAASLAACGGKVAIDGAAGAGGAATSSNSASSSSTSASSTSTSASSTSASSSSTSASSSSTGGEPCPDPFPGIEAMCGTEGMMCAVPNACCGGMAVCKGGFWQFVGPICGQPCTPTCGPDAFACVPGTLCVAYIGMVTTYQCRVSPCFEQLSCGCADSLCAEQGMKCNNIQDEFKVLCD